jgi:hypothetical protein
MSEYQYYEFQSIDRRLTPAEQAEIKKMSSRAQVTPNQAIFLYNYGDFQGSTEKFLTKYFDAMLYLANWGTWQLMFRFPRAIVKPELFQPYELDDVITVTTTDHYVVLDITIRDENGMSGWVEGEGWLPQLLPLRDDLMAGDLRLLYISWLRMAPNLEEEDDEDLTEPPIPPNLAQFSPPLQSFMELIELDLDLVTAAAQASPNEEVGTALPLEHWLPALTATEKEEFLLQLVKREPHVDLQLIKRLQELAGKDSETPTLTPGFRSFAEIMAIAEDVTEQRQQKEKRAAQAKRAKQLTAMAPREDQMWQRVLDLIVVKQAQPYDEATAILQDLRDLAESQGRLAEFSQRFAKLKSSYSNRPALMTRWAKIKIDSNK